MKAVNITFKQTFISLVSCRINDKTTLYSTVIQTKSIRYFILCYKSYIYVKSIVLSDFINLGVKLLVNSLDLNHSRDNLFGVYILI